MDPVSIGELSAAESRILLAVEQSWDAPRSAVPADNLGLGKEIPFRAEVLRRLLLGLPLPIDGKGKERVVKVPDSGITLQKLFIEEELSLRSACRPDGSALPPLTFKHCVFLKRIHLSAARFRRLGFHDCWLSHLRGIGLHVEGGFNLRAITTCEGVPEWGTEKKTGAAELPPETEKVRKNVEPNESNPDIREARCKPSSDGNRGLCWIELRGSYVGGDLDVSKSQLVCGPEDPEFRNSPHARYALDLRGSRIMGRLSMNVPKVKEPTDLKKEADTKQEREAEEEPESKQELVPFTALGGVSIVRCYIGGSVCGSGSKLVAVEGNAFTAQRAEIKGHVFLDYSSEGWSNWERFEARGFIDLNDVKIGSSLQMSGASLLRDHLSRAGLVVSGAQIADKCWLCGIEEKINRTQVDTSQYPKFHPFYSAGGVNLSRTTICGELDMCGAFLDPSSWGTSLYAPALNVHGDAKLTAFSGSRPANFMPFRSNGILKLVSAHFFMKLDLRGAQLNFPEQGREGVTSELDPQWRRIGCIVGRPESTSILWWEKALDARLLRVEGTLLCRPARYEAAGPDAATTGHLRFLSDGSVDLQGARIGGRVEMSGAWIKTSCSTRVAVNLSRVQVQDKVNLCHSASEDHDEGSPFEALGTIDLRHAHITTELNLKRAQLERPLVWCLNSDKKPEYEKLRTLWADSATITSIEMQRCKSIGSISMTGLQCTNGILADELELRNGTLDLWQSNLGYLSLDKFHMHGTPLKEDLHPREQGVDFLHFNNVTITGKLIMKMVEGRIGNPCKRSNTMKRYPFPYVNLRELRIDALEDDGGLGWNRFLRLKLEGFRCERAPVRDIAFDKVHEYRKIRIRFAGIRRSINQPSLIRLRRNVRCAVLKRWRTSFIGKLWRRSSAAKIWRRVRSFVATSWRGMKTAVALVWRQRIRRRSYRKRGIPHIHFLNLQYQNDWPTIIEFTASAYDRLSESLRFDGHDREARRVLSAKLDIKGAVDIGGFFAPIWFLFKKLFDYGLSSARTLGTFVACLVVGTCFWWCSSHGIWVPYKPDLRWYGPVPYMHWQNGILPIPSWTDFNDHPKWKMDWHRIPHSHGSLVYVQSAVTTEVVGGKEQVHSRAGILAAHTRVKMPDVVSKEEVGATADGHGSAKNEPVDASVRVPTANPEYNEVSCKLLGAKDSVLYAFDSFVPILDHLRPAQCEISPEDDDAVWWRIGRTAYSVLGWVVTSITLLTLPGFLRKSAEE